MPSPSGLIDALTETWAGIGAYEWRAAEDTLEWSPGLIELYGLTEGPRSESEFSRLVHPDDRVRVEAETAGYLGGDAADYSHRFRIVRPDGEVRVVLDRGVIERDGEGRVQTIRGINVDITELAGLGLSPASDNDARLAVAGHITASVEGVAAAAEERARLAAALRAGGLGIHDFDPRSGSIVWDDTTRSFWGLEDGEPVTYEIFRDGLHPDDVGPTEAAVNAALNPDGPRRYEATYRVIDRQTGQLRWVRADGDVTFDKDVPVRLVGTVQDVTEQKQAADALRESEERFRKMADSAPVMIWVTEADGECSYLNSCWYEFTGQTTEEALGFGWLGAVHPDDAPEAERAFRAATERQEPFRIEYRLRRKDGVYRWVIDSAGPRLGHEGVFLGFTGSVIDITDRKEVEQRLRGARDTFRNLVECSPFGLYAVDSDFRLVQVSEGAQKVFENVRPLLGRDFAEVLRVIWPEPFASEAIDRFRHTLETGEEYHAPSTVEVRADISATEAYDWKLSRVTMPDGRPGVVCHFYDLSERQAYEEKVQYLMREVNHRAKNMLSLVDAIAQQTAATRPETFSERFSQRMKALASSQDLLIQTEWKGAELAVLVESQLLHFSDLFGRRIWLSGPKLDLSSSAAQALGMAMHELATNAAKYGALSNARGRVEISWYVETTGKAPTFSITWKEFDGPPVVTPANSGFGSRVVRTMVERAVSGMVTLDYAKDGVAWSLQCPLAAIVQV